MATPVLTIVTSQQCPACRSKRGTGALSSRNPPAFPDPRGTGRSWNEEFFRDLLRGGNSSGPARLIVFEVHFRDNSASMDKVDSFSQFTLEGEHVKRQSYYNEGEGLTYSEEVGNDAYVVKREVDNYTFDQYLQGTFPAELKDFVGAYPGWIFASQHAWGRAIRKQEPLYAVSGKFQTVRKPMGAGYQVLFEHGIQTGDPIALAKKICDNPELLEPQVEEKPYYPAEMPRSPFYFSNL